MHWRVQDSNSSPAPTTTTSEPGLGLLAAPGERFPASFFPAKPVLECKPGGLTSTSQVGEPSQVTCRESYPDPQSPEKGWPCLNNPSPRGRRALGWRRGRPSRRLPSASEVPAGPWRDARRLRGRQPVSPPAARRPRAWDLAARRAGPGLLYLPLAGSGSRRSSAGRGRPAPGPKAGARGAQAGVAAGARPLGPPPN